MGQRPGAVVGGIMRAMIVVVLGALAVARLAAAQNPQVGDTVVLVEPDIHIPAHPAPGDTDVPFRFTSGSSALVMAIDPATGWFQIRGEQVGGAQTVGRITKSFIASVGGPGMPAELAWCPPKGSPTPHAGGRLRVATWNLGNLHAKDGESTFGGSDPSEKRLDAA